MRINKKYILILVLLLIVVLGSDVLAQCPMCRMSAEANLENGGTEGKGLNKGILYMLALPYILISSIGYLWWKNNKRADQELSD